MENKQINTFTLSETTCTAISKYCCKKAFTLAEVLITLGIIGVVVAMTLPPLINNIQDKHFNTAFRKQYSIMSQALLMIYAKNEAPFYLSKQNHSNWEEMDIYFCEIAKELKAVHKGINCDDMTVRTTIKWHSNNKWFNKKGEPQQLNGGYWHRTFILADGTMLNFNCWDNIYIDVNGFKKPNMIGRDIFQIKLLMEKENTAVKYSFPYNTNGCTGGPFSTLITKDNYEEDCKSGTGWGCSPLYILD